MVGLLNSDWSRVLKYCHAHKRSYIKRYDLLWKTLGYPDLGVLKRIKLQVGAGKDDNVFSVDTNRVIRLIRVCLPRRQGLFLKE